MGKIIIIKTDDPDDMLFQKIVSLLSISNEKIELIHANSANVLSFPGLEIQQHQRRVLRDGKDISLTRLEYSTLVFLASNPGIVLTRSQIFETVWNMDSNSCHSNVGNVICNLRKKIEPDSKNPTHIKTVLGVGYKFSG